MYLLDTNILLWSIYFPDKISSNIISLLENSENKCFVSAASLWEVSIKFSLSRLEFLTNINSLFELIEKTELELLVINNEHIKSISCLPFHHKDPFDRMLIAQAICEDLTILTSDIEFEKYRINVITN